MKRMSNRPTRRVSVKLVCTVLFSGSLLAAQANPTVIVVGIPAPPTNVGLNVPYSIKVTVTAPSPYYAQGCTIESASSQNGVYSTKAGFAFSGMAPSGTHTFSVVNQANGSYWWRAVGGDSEPVTKYTVSSGIGAFTTP